MNPIIGGWGRYFNLDNSSRYRVFIQKALYKQCWKWMYRKHLKAGQLWLTQQYFLRKAHKKDESDQDQLNRDYHITPFQKALDSNQEINFSKDQVERNNNNDYRKITIKNQLSLPEG